MIKTLNKQLTHCEPDLQTHMDEVPHLENSLTDSETNRESDPTMVTGLRSLTRVSSPKSTYTCHRAGTRTGLAQWSDGFV